MRDEKKFCQDCKYYDRNTKVCAERKHFVARKNYCDRYVKK
jgi:hypothetical protein